MYKHTSGHRIHAALSFAITPGFQYEAMHVRWTSLGRLEAALISVCSETVTRREPAAVAPDSAWAAMANPAKVRRTMKEM